jgi:hypothetical protein
LGGLNQLLNLVMVVVMGDNHGGACNHMSLSRVTMAVESKGTHVIRAHVRL